MIEPSLFQAIHRIQFAAVIPPFHAAVDKAISYLHPTNGLLGVADFFVSGKHDLPMRQMNPLRRFFWRWELEIIFSKPALDSYHYQTLYFMGVDGSLALGLPPSFTSLALHKSHRTPRLYTTLFCKSPSFTVLKSYSWQDQARWKISSSCRAAAWLDTCGCSDWRWDSFQHLGYFDCGGAPTRCQEAERQFVTLALGIHLLCRATFDTDNIDIGPERRNYLDHRLSRVWETNGQVKLKSNLLCAQSRTHS